MKSYNLNTRQAKIIRFLLSCFLLSGLACHSAKLASGKTGPGETVNGQTEKSSANVSSSYTTEDNRVNNPVISAAGTYQLNNHRPGREGYENSLVITQKSGGKIHVLFEGTFFYQANGAESFHDTAAEGDLTLKSNTASGKLIEEGSENGCTIDLNFSDERLNLKSSGCDLNVTPDGVYKKETDPATKKNIDGPDGDISEEKDNSPKNSNNDKKPFIQYDFSGDPNGVVNLMASDEDREGCGKEILRFAGKVMKVDNSDEFLYEFTLVNGNRKRQNLTLVVSKEDKLSPADLRSIIAVGNNLEVTYIDCGNAPIASPLAIYKK